MKKHIYKILIGLLVIVTLFTLYYFVLWVLDKKVVKPGDTPPVVTEEPVKEKYPPELKAKLEKLEFINEEITYFDMKLLDRYLAYQVKFPDLTIDKIILNVNMNLDRPFYTEIENTESYEIDKLLVNKYYTIGKYAPNDLVYINSKYSRAGAMLRSEAKVAFEEMAEAARSIGLRIRASSAYRSYEAQRIVYNSYVSRSGQRSADTYSARAGHSEHQTGLTVDVDNAAVTFTSFINTKEYQWMKENSYKYGFIQRYLKGKENISGYVAEEWHYRYLGKEMASKVYESGLSFDEYYAMYIKKMD